MNDIYKYDGTNQFEYDCTDYSFSLSWAMTSMLAIKRLFIEVEEVILKIHELEITIKPDMVCYDKITINGVEYERKNHG